MKYKIVISQISEKEVPDTDYKKTGEIDEKGEAVYGYVENGEMQIKRDERNIYSQELEDLDLGELAIFINRAR